MDKTKDYMSHWLAGVKARSGGNNAKSSHPAYNEGMEAYESAKNQAEFEGVKAELTRTAGREVPAHLLLLDQIDRATSDNINHAMFVQTGSTIMIAADLKRSGFIEQVTPDDSIDAQGLFFKVTTMGKTSLSTAFDVATDVLDGDNDG